MHIFYRNIDFFFEQFTFFLFLYVVKWISASPTRKEKADLFLINFVFHFPIFVRFLWNLFLDKRCIAKIGILNIGRRCNARKECRLIVPHIFFKKVWKLNAHQYKYKEKYLIGYTLWIFFYFWKNLWCLLIEILIQISE